MFFVWFFVFYDFGNFSFDLLQIMVFKVGLLLLIFENQFLEL